MATVAFLPLSANLTDNPESKKHYWRAKWRHFEMIGKVKEEKSSYKNVVMER